MSKKDVNSFLITDAGIWTSEIKKYRAHLDSQGKKSSSGDRTHALVTGWMRMQSDPTQ